MVARYAKDHMLDLATDSDIDGLFATDSDVDGLSATD